MGGGRGSRRRWTEEEKRQIVAQTRIPGVTVAEVARRCEVNTNLVFSWRRDPRLGAEAAPEPRPLFVPVEVVPGAFAAGSGPEWSYASAKLRIGGATPVRQRSLQRLLPRCEF